MALLRQNELSVDPEIRGIELGVVDAIRTCYDPEIPVNIYDLGLIYNVEVAPDKNVKITMTLTSPMCPVAESLPPEVEDKARSVYGVIDAKVEVVWEPPWNPGMMTEDARLELGMF
ncbi:MAG TPA: iron-sulfur cluster assembly protein [Candidatus Xenobia bacterium]|jgi:FeS assembly SUF system protein